MKSFLALASVKNKFTTLCLILSIIITAAIWLIGNEILYQIHKMSPAGGSIATCIAFLKWCFAFSTVFILIKVDNNIKRILSKKINNMVEDLQKEADLAGKQNNYTQNKSDEKQDTHN